MTKKEFQNQFVKMVYGEFGKYDEFRDVGFELTELCEKFLGIAYDTENGTWELTLTEIEE